MSGILNEDDLSAVAAEYVIGTLDPDERERANALLDVDEGFRALVRTWERRLGELHLMVEPVEPDERIWDRIRDRLGVRAPPSFAPQAVAMPTAAPFAAPASTPMSAPISAPSSVSAFASPMAPSAPEPRLESKPELVLDAPLPSSPPPLSPPPFSTAAPSSPPPFPPPGQRTPEQELASLIEEADKFTTELAELASEQSKAGQDSEPAEPSAEAVSHAESLLAEAADAIAAKPLESDHVEQAEDETWPKQAAVAEDLPPPIRTGPRREATSLMSPADVAHLTVQRQARHIGRWRAAALVMAFLVFGLGSLIATWRFAPDRLPQQLQPIAVLGLGEWSPSERIPAEHGTQFEE